MDESAARMRLEEERRRLEAIRDEQGQSEDPSGATRITEIDPRGADAGTEVFDRQVDLSIVEHAEGELREIDEAFQRLERGEYGVCQECGRIIPDDRLEVVPATRYCIDHQERREARAGVQQRETYGDPSLYT